MKAIGTGNKRMLVLDRGEEVATTIIQYCKEQGISAASFTGIGAVDKVAIGYYDLHKREYFFATPEGEYEVASMTGNIAMVDGAPFAHIHAVLSACDISCATIGGHVKTATVAVTLEVVFSIHDAAMGRALNEEVGLKLLCPLG